MKNSKRRRALLSDPRTTMHHVQRMHHHAVRLGARCSAKDDRASELTVKEQKKQVKERKGE